MAAFDEIKLELGRRSVLGGMLALYAGVHLSGCSDPRAPEDVDLLSLPAHDARFLDAIADLIIPETDTAGALGVGAPQMVLRAANYGLIPADKVTWVTNLTALRSKLDGNAGSFIRLPAKQRAQVLAEFDTIAFAGPNDQAEASAAFYKELKSAIAAAYYLSEPGATNELRYEPVPGQWRGCIPLEDGDRTWAV